LFDNDKLFTHLCSKPKIDVSVLLCVVVFACLGFLSPANRGSLMTCVLVLYVCLGTPAGYVSARIYKSEFDDVSECEMSNVNLYSALSSKPLMR